MIFKLDDNDRKIFSNFVNDHNKNTEVISERIALDLFLEAIEQKEDGVFIIGKKIQKEEVNSWGCSQENLPDGRYIPGSTIILNVDKLDDDVKSISISAIREILIGKIVE
jgi:hypothetical protein